MVTTDSGDVAGVKRSEDEEPARSTWSAAGSRRSGSIPARAPSPAALEAHFGPGHDPCRPGADPRQIEAWEHRHGYPPARRACAPGWCSPTGSTRDGPMIHPLSAIGPMVPFARVPEPGRPARELVRAGQPERRDGLHRPRLSLAGGGLPDLHVGRRPGAEPPSGDRDELRGVVPRVLHRGGREYWFEPGFFAPGRPLERASPAHARPAAAGSPPAAGASGPAADPSGGRRPLDRHDPGDQPGRRRGDLPAPPARFDLRRRAVIGPAPVRSAGGAGVASWPIHRSRPSTGSWRLARRPRDGPALADQPGGPRRRARVPRPPRPRRVEARRPAGRWRGSRPPCTALLAQVPRPRHGADEPGAVRRGEPAGPEAALEGLVGRPADDRDPASSSSARASTSAS